jgi:hypothetical protein
MDVNMRRLSERDVFCQIILDYIKLNLDYFKRIKDYSKPF